MNHGSNLLYDSILILGTSWVLRAQGRLIGLDVLMGLKTLNRSASLVLSIGVVLYSAIIQAVIFSL